MNNELKYKTVYVELEGEDIEVHRPVKAYLLKYNIYKIDLDQEIPNGEKWKFSPGDEVYCIIKNEKIFAIRKFVENN